MLTALQLNRISPRRLLQLLSFCARLRELSPAPLSPDGATAGSGGGSGATAGSGSGIGGGGGSSDNGISGSSGSGVTESVSKDKNSSQHALYAMGDHALVQSNYQSTMMQMEWTPSKPSLSTSKAAGGGGGGGGVSTGGGRWATLGSLAEEMKMPDLLGASFGSAQIDAVVPAAAQLRSQLNAKAAQDDDVVSWLW